MLDPYQLKKLLAEFERLPSRVPSRTFMEISGNPHYENVCSNILAFYFDPTAEHGLKDLLLRSLMLCLKMGWESPIEHAEIGREVYSEQRGRLDILIQTEMFVVGIENKIFAGLFNDLDDYRDLIASRTNAKKISSDSTHYVVLSLRPLPATEITYLSKAGFLNLTYPELLDAARGLLGFYSAKADLKFMGYFSDFMQTIDNLTGQRPEADLSKFFAKNGVLIEELSQKYWQFRNRKAPELMAATRPWLEKHLKEGDFNQSIYEKTTVVTHIRATGTDQDKAVSVDLAFDLNCWVISLFARGYSDYKQTPECHSFFKELIPSLLERLGDDWLPHENAGLRKTFDRELSDEAMANNLESVFLSVTEVLGWTMSQ